MPGQALEEAFRLLWQIRIEHQVRQVRAGLEPDDFVDPRELGPIARLGLKEAFPIIGNEQQGLATPDRRALLSGRPLTSPWGRTDALSC